MFTLHNGDCLEYIKALQSESIDCTITDPPYDERTHSGGVHYTAVEQIGNDDVGIDDFAPLLDPAMLAKEFLRISKRWCLAFCTFESMKQWRDVAWEQKAWVRSGVWDRVNVTPQFTGDRPAQAAEGIAIFHRYGRKHWNGGGKSAIWRYMVESGKKEHPTQKPLLLMKHLVSQFSDVGETIFDPFMGSGTTGVAAISLGRNFIGCELDPVYFSIAERRIKSAALQPGLFTPSNNRVQRTGGESGQQNLFSAGEVLPAKVTRQSTRR